ncbi:MAG: hypothetical protein Q9198_008796 [Flavoplaca austrocitrina]
MGEDSGRGRGSIDTMKMQLASKASKLGYVESKKNKVGIDSTYWEMAKIIKVQVIDGEEHVTSALKRSRLPKHPAIAKSPTSKKQKAGDQSHAHTEVKDNPIKLRDTKLLPVGKSAWETLDSLKIGDTINEKGVKYVRFKWMCGGQLERQIVDYHNCCINMPRKISEHDDEKGLPALASSEVEDHDENAILEGDQDDTILEGHQDDTIFEGDQDVVENE